MVCKVCGAKVKNPGSPSHFRSRNHQNALVTGDLRIFFELINVSPMNHHYNQIEGEVDKLQLSQLKLTHLPSMIEKFPKLTSLRLSYNNLAKLPDTIVNLKQLRFLDLSKNKITNLPKGMDSLESLEELHLSDNKLEDVPEEIFRLPNLKRLYLSNNKFGTKLWDALSKANNTSVETFKIEKLGLDKLNDSILNLENVTELSLDENEFDHIPELAAQFRNLITLSLRGNKIERIREGFFAQNKFSVLSGLYLGENMLSSLPDDISSLRTLRFLGLHKNKFTEFPNQILGIGLNFLSINSNDIGELPIELVNTYWNILDLSDNPKLPEFNASYSKWSTSLIFDSHDMTEPLEFFQEKLCIRVIKKYIYEKKPLTELIEKVNDVKLKEFILTKSSDLKDLLVFRIMNPSFMPQLQDRIKLLKRSNPALEELEVLIGKKIPHVSDLMELETKFGYCSIEGRKIIGINLNECGLEKFPTKLMLFPSLTALFLNGNQITELPRELGDMPSLEVLSIGNNKFEGFHPDMSEIPKLEGLELSSNDYSNIMIDYTKFPNLNTLYLENCNLNEIPDEILKINTLKHLNLSNNALTEIPIALVENLNELESLDLSSNKMKTVPDGIERLRNLNSLKLKGNTIKKSSIKKEDFENLEILEL